MGIRYNLLRSTLFALVFCASNPAWAENVVFTISYVDAVDQTKPIATSCTVDQRLTVTLHDGNKVTEQPT
jgi:hypothetical protein